MKKILLICLSVIAVFAFAGCSLKKSIPQEPPEITITLDNQTIGYVVGKNKWNGAAYDREDIFKTILKKDSKIAVPYIKLGKMLNLEFKQNPPETIEIFDYLLNENGDKRYTYREVVQIPAKLKEGKCSFEFNEHPASMLSSNFESYKAGKTLRGFKVICMWGNNNAVNECEYGFVIRTDATRSIPL